MAQAGAAEARVHARLMQAIIEAQSCREQLRQWQGQGCTGLRQSRFTGGSIVVCAQLKRQQ